MPQNLTTYLNDAKSKLGNLAVVNRNGNTTYKILSSTVDEYNLIEVATYNPLSNNVQIDGIMASWFNDGVTFVPPTYATMQAAWDTHKAFPTKADMGLEPKLIGAYPFSNVPDAVSTALKLLLDRKLWEYNLNRGIVTANP